jgi:uncharacterized Ntn-hydrolase superfamily protein
MVKPLPRVLSLLASLALPLLPATARATYSIVAVDRTAGEVGGAVTSCVGSQGVGVVYRPSVGHGGVNAQAAANATGRDRAVMLLDMDVAPADIITMITASSFDSRAAMRQYGVVDLMGRAAGFTGSSAMNYKEDRQGTSGAYTYSVQGNILTSKAVIDHAEAAFRDTGCDLADKLMLALEGGAMGGEGDSRCTPQGIPSDAASIEVDRTGETAGAYLKLSVAGTGNTSAVVRLRAMFDSWRATHACGAGGAGGAGGTGGAGGRGGAGGSVDARGGAGGTIAGRGGTGGASGRGGAAGDSATGGRGGASGGATGGAAGSQGGGAGSGSGGGTEPGDDSGGCSCHAGVRGARSFGLVAMAAGLSLLLRRTRRRRV